MISYDGNVITYNDRWIEITDPLNPLNLPPYTIRLLYKDGVTPTFSYGTATQISSSPNIWDLTYENSSWVALLSFHIDLLEVLGANSTGVTSMNSMFVGCYSLTTVPLFDTSKVRDMGNMFEGCSSLTSIPLFNTSNVTNMLSMFHYCSSLTYIPLFNTSKVTIMVGTFYNCNKVESGALALYQQASTQTNPPTDHQDTFLNCGINTTTGSAELSQIPSSWGGTGE